MEETKSRIKEYKNVGKDPEVKNKIKSAKAKTNI